MTTARAVPFFCPFCGEESLRPWGDDPDKGHGDWRCEDCTRVFSLRYQGISGTEDQTCSPHSVLAAPDQRPARGSSPGAT